MVRGRVGAGTRGRVACLSPLILHPVCAHLPHVRARGIVEGQITRLRSRMVLAPFVGSRGSLAGGGLLSWRGVRCGGGVGLMSRLPLRPTGTRGGPARICSAVSLLACVQTSGTGYLAVCG
ncbi:hypothetical protein T492DRAFT_945669 [Pavlovales sp. CCMP2436]|nr:hypothetical protein T492DRAFT_945669 [Pavlovales sp. CCMP2436]